MRESLRRASVLARRQLSCEDARPTRRWLITRLLRNASLAVLALVGGAVVVKRRRLLREGECLNEGICRDCGVYDECGLPRALSTKSVLTRIRDGG
jgi:hypothetical protein